MSAGWFFLAAMIGMYGVANLLQSIAAANTTAHDTLDPKLLVRLARHRTYVAGLVCQILGFILAFLARRDLPLFLVQSAVAAGLGVTAVLGVLVLKWKLPPTEIALLRAALRRPRRPGRLGRAAPVPPARHRPACIGLLVVLGALAVAGFFAARLQGRARLGRRSAPWPASPSAPPPSPPGRWPTSHSFDKFITDPLLYLLIAHSLVGQLLLGLAMQRGSTTAAVAAMDAAAAVPAAIIGLLFLGDKITPGLEWVAGLGFLVTLGAVIGLTFFAEPQHHHQIAGRHRVDDPPEPGRARRAAPGDRPARDPSRAGRHRVPPAIRGARAAVSGQLAG